MRLACFALVLFGAACQPRSELVVGIVTDLPVPSELDLVTLEADQSEGVPIEQREWPRDGALVLPGSYGLYTDNGTAPALTLTVAGYRGAKRLVERRATATLVVGKTLYLRLGLAGACETVSCPAGQTCIDGACAGESVDPAALPDYRPERVGEVDCASGPVWIDTASGQPLPVGGGCASGERCQEGLCVAR